MPQATKDDILAAAAFGMIHQTAARAGGAPAAA